MCSWVQSPAFPYDRYESLGRNHGDASVVLQRQEVFISGDNIGGLGTLSRGNYHVIIRITDHDGNWGQISHKGSKSTETVNKIDGLLIGVVVALTVAPLLIEQYPLCLVENLFREVQEKKPWLFAIIEASV